MKNKLKLNIIVFILIELLLWTNLVFAAGDLSGFSKNRHDCLSPQVQISQNNFIDLFAGSFNQTMRQQGKIKRTLLNFKEQQEKIKGKEKNFPFNFTDGLKKYFKLFWKNHRDFIKKFFEIYYYPFLMICGMAFVMYQKTGLPFDITQDSFRWFAQSFITFQVFWHMSHVWGVGKNKIFRETVLEDAFGLDKILVSFLSGVILIPAVFTISYCYCFGSLIFNSLLVAAILTPHLLLIKKIQFPTDRRKKWLLIAGLFLSFKAILFFELYYAVLYKQYFNLMRACIYWQTVFKDEGKNLSGIKMVYPKTGLYSKTKGYILLPDLISFLINKQGFDFKAKTAQSRLLIDLIKKRSIMPPVWDQGNNFLIIDPQERIIYEYNDPYRIEKFSDVDPLIIKMLLAWENTKLLQLLFPELRVFLGKGNYIIEERRLVNAIYSIIYSNISHDYYGRVHGASTIAIQLAKILHSENGKTKDFEEKIKQLIHASLLFSNDNPQLAAQNILLNYLNWVPFAGGPNGYLGEVIGFGEALYAFYGISLTELNTQLKDPQLRTKALKRIAALMGAIRNPSILRNNGGNEEANLLLKKIQRMEFISEQESKTAQETYDYWNPQKKVLFNGVPYGKNRAALSMRNWMVKLLRESTPEDLINLNTLNRMDIRLRASNDHLLQQKLYENFVQMYDPYFLQKYSFAGRKLINLRNNDISQLRYSCYVVEKGGDASSANKVVAHIDTFDDQQFDYVLDSKTELGSTAKLRIFLQFLTIVADVYNFHKSFAQSSVELEMALAQKSNPISQWVIAQLYVNPDLSLKDILEKALKYKVSAMPGKFFTAGGWQQINNYHPAHNLEAVSVDKALILSINLVFVRLAEQIFEYYVEQTFGYAADEICKNHNNPVWQEYATEVLQTEKKHIAEEIIKFIRQAKQNKGNIKKTIAQMKNKTYQDFFKRLAKKQSKWLKQQIKSGYQPDSKQTKMIINSTAEWLLSPAASHEMYRRIYTDLEKSIFYQKITPFWQKLGYPFKVIPTLSVALGPSGDTPGALVDLISILINKGVKKDTQEVGEIQLARETPFASFLNKMLLKSEQVLSKEIAEVGIKVLKQVVLQGSAQRAKIKNSVLAEHINIFGKTGTGDNKKNRIAVFLFGIEDKYSGIVTVYTGEDRVKDFNFTSSLAVKMFSKLVMPAMVPKIMPQIEGQVVEALQSPSNKKRFDAAELIRISISSGYYDSDKLLYKLKFLKNKYLRQLLKCIKIIDLSKLKDYEQESACSFIDSLERIIKNKARQKKVVEDSKVAMIALEQIKDIFYMHNINPEMSI
ncbi:MAG: transglycosylase domain-containing protein [Candidatus Omnitrophota bacterium]